MAKPPLLALRDATVRFDRRPTFAGVSVALSVGDRVCLVGRNGGGKSTLLKALAGTIEVDAGSVFRQPGARIAYVPQQPVFSRTKSASGRLIFSLSSAPTFFSSTRLLPEHTTRTGRPLMVRKTRDLAICATSQPMAAAASAEVRVLASNSTTA